MTTTKSNGMEARHSQLLSVLEHTTDGYFLLDDQGRFVHVNAQAGFLLYRDHLSLIGKTLWTEFPEAASPYFASKYAEAKQSGQPVVYVGFFAHTALLYEFKVIPHEAAVSVLIRDVSKRARGHEGEGRFRSLFERHPDAVYSIMPGGLVTNANQAALELLGYRYDEILYVRQSDFVLPRDLLAADSCYKEVMQGKASYCRLSLQRKNGEQIITDVTMLPMTEEGQQIGAYAIVRDVTETCRMHRQLEESQRRYKLLSDNVLDIITYLCPEGRFQYVSPAIERLLGYTPEEVLGTVAWKYFHPEFRHAIDGKLIPLDESGLSTCRVRHRDGRFIWFEIAHRSVIDEEGQEQLVGVWRDISERKKAEQHLLQAQRIGRFGSWEFNLGDGSIRWSEETYRMFGLDPGTTVTLAMFMSLVHPDDREAVMESFQSLRRTDEAEVYYRIIQPDGDVRYIHTAGERMYMDGEPVSAHGIHSDQTERVQEEKTLSLRRDSLRMAQQIAGIGYFEWDAVSDQWTLSNEIYDLWQMDRQSTNFRIGAMLSVIHPEDRWRVERAIAEALKGASMNLTYRLVSPSDGGIQTLHTISQTMMCSEQGIPLRILGTVHNVTEQKQSEELLRQSEKLSTAGQLAAGIAHEIRNPLTALKGFAKLLRQAPEDKRESYYEIMKSEFSRIELILSELLVLAKPQVVSRKPGNIGMIMTEVLELLSSQALLHNVLIKYNVENGLPQVNCERNQLKQVFVNIVKNAIEAMPGGGLLDISLYQEDGQVRARFADQGGGIPPERLARIGEPFFTTKDQGTGLGVMVSRSMIEEHQGTIRYESDYGYGTTVYISLPVWEE